MTKKKTIKNEYLCMTCGSPRLYSSAGFVSPNDDESVDGEEARKEAWLRFEEVHGTMFYCAACDSVGTTNAARLVVAAKDAPTVFN